MSRHRRQGEPPHTCPVIDDAVGYVNNTRDLLEKLREANDALRSWGQEHYDRAEELEGSVTDLEREADKLRDEIADLKRELQEAYNTPTP